LKSSVNRLCLFPAIAVSSRDYSNGSPLFQGKSTPALYDWMIFRMFEVVSSCLTKHGKASWGELLALTALDSIKADILRRGIFLEKKAETA
jgi:hypothetical protein